MRKSMEDLARQLGEAQAAVRSAEAALRQAEECHPHATTAQLQELAGALVGLANLCAERATLLRRALPAKPVHSEEEEAIVREINQLHLEASELYARAMRVDSSTARSIASTSCIWQAPPEASLSFRTLADSDTGEKEMDQVGDEQDEAEEDSEDESDEDEMDDETQERHMFDLARHQYESQLRQSSDPRIMMRYARLLVHRLEEKARVYTEQEQEEFLARSMQLLQLIRNAGGELAEEATTYSGRVESLAKNKRTRHTSRENA